MLLYSYINRPLEDVSHPNAVDLPSKNAKLTLSQVIALLPRHDRNRQLFIRARTQDPGFGYVWKDISSPEQIVPSVGENIICRIGFSDELRVTGERAPIVKPGVGKSQIFLSSSSALPLGAATPSTKQTATPAPQPSIQSSTQSSVPIISSSLLPNPSLAAPASIVTKADPNAQEQRKRKQESLPPVPVEDSDGLTPDERARRRIEVREAQEAAERERKVNEVREAEERKVLFFSVKIVKSQHRCPMHLNTYMHTHKNIVLDARRQEPDVHRIASCA